MKRRLASLLMFVAAAAAAETLGRLFFTPEQRAALERQRQSGRSGLLAEEAPSIRLDGVMIDASGRTTVWRNGRADVGTRPVMKVGETLDATSGTRSDVVVAGAVRVERRRPAP